MKIIEWLKLSIIDRYIIRQYFTTFLFTLGLLSAITVVFDVSERIEKFISKNVDFWVVVGDYYLNFIPWINSLLFPLYTLITVIFFTSRLAEKTEIIPMLGSGMSFDRLLKPYILSSIFFTIIHLFLNHSLVPKGNNVIGEFEAKYLKSNTLTRKDRNIHYYVAPGVEAYVNAFNSYDSTGTGFQLRKIENAQIVQILSASTIKYDAVKDSWKLRDYDVRTWKHDTETYERYYGAELDTVLNLSVSDFVIYKNYKDRMPTADLNKFIDRERKKGSGITRQYEVEKHRRTADPFTTLILSFIGACIASRKVRGGLGLHLAAGVILGVIFIFLSKLSLTFANNELINPLLAVWMPNIIFIFLSIYIYNSAQK